MSIGNEDLPSQEAICSNSPIYAGGRNGKRVSLGSVYIGIVPVFNIFYSRNILWSEEKRGIGIIIIVSKGFVWRYSEAPCGILWRLQRDGKKGDLGYE